MNITIYHNPDRGTSLNTLAMNGFPGRARTFAGAVRTSAPDSGRADFKAPANTTSAWRNGFDAADRRSEGRSRRPRWPNWRADRGPHVFRRDPTEGAGQR